ncbi:DUF371 domain-containing protein, partial [Kibdelosporangium lantanae]
MIHLRAHGHENVRATHAKTFELTDDPTITPRATCVLGVDAHPVGDVRALAGPVSITLTIGDHVVTTTGIGNP